MSSFCIWKCDLQKLLTFFFSKNTCELDTVLTKTIHIWTTNKLGKLTMLWTTGPSYLTFEPHEKMCLRAYCQRRLISACTSVQSDQSYLWPYLWNLSNPKNPRDKVRRLMTFNKCVGWSVFAGSTCPKPHFLTALHIKISVKQTESYRTSANVHTNDCLTLALLNKLRCHALC